MTVLFLCHLDLGGGGGGDFLGGLKGGGDRFGGVD